MIDFIVMQMSRVNREKGYYLVILPLMQHHIFFRNLPPLLARYSGLLKGQVCTWWVIVLGVGMITAT